MHTWPAPHATVADGAQASAAAVQLAGVTVGVSGDGVQAALDENVMRTSVPTGPLQSLALLTCAQVEVTATPARQAVVPQTQSVKKSIVVEQAPAVPQVQVEQVAAGATSPAPPEKVVAVAAGHAGAEAPP
jgi:hypothetical protein